MSDENNLEDVFGTLRRTEESLKGINPEYIRQQYAEMQKLLADAVAELEKPRNRPNGQSPQQV